MNSDKKGKCDEIWNMVITKRVKEQSDADQVDETQGVCYYRLVS